MNCLEASDIDPVIATQQWLKQIVIGENFCPFAKREFERQRIRYLIITPDNASNLESLLVEEYQLLDNDPAGDSIETTLIIFSPSLKDSSISVGHGLNAHDFDDFLLITDEANWQLTRLGYEGIYQIASFHPQYLFAGESPESASHFTNRSPFPMLHIIREKSIERALKTFKEPESIPESNIKKAHALGVDYFKNVLAESMLVARAKRQPTIDN